MRDLVLKPGRDRSPRRRHPWVLSGSVAELRGGGGIGEPGECVRVCSAEGDVVGFGHLSPRSSIRVRMIAFGEKPPDDDWLADRMARAVALRGEGALCGSTDALRLVNAEGDGLPGLVVDRYADVVVAVLTGAGMVLRRDAIAAALHDITGAKHGLERADRHAARSEGVATETRPLWGEPPPTTVPILERDRRFEVDLVAGQKTGFYLDQRDARDLVASLAAGRRVLDLYAYTGGFSVAAARGGAREIVAVESSSAAAELAERHLTANAPDCPARVVRGDVARFLRGDDPGAYDLVVVDPPPLARRKSDVVRATRAYKDVILRALRCAAPGAHLLAFACSHHVDAALFRKVAFAASLDARRPLQVLRELSAPADHPVALDHPEGAYLTGLLLRA